MTDITALRAYLETNYPTELAAGADGAILAAMLAPGGTRTDNVSPGQFATWAAAGPRASIEDHATNPASPLRASALALRDFLGGSMPEFDLSNPAIAYTLAAWVTAGAITQQQSDDLIALAQVPITVAERDGFAGVSMADITAARVL